MKSQKTDSSSHFDTAAVTSDHVASQPDSTDDVLYPGVRQRTVSRI